MVIADKPIPESLKRYGAQSAYYNLKYGTVISMSYENDKVICYGGMPEHWYTADLVPGGFSGKARANFKDVTEDEAINLINKAWED